MANVIQYRRLSALLLGVWLGASITSTDLAVTQNFQTIDRFLDTPGNAATSAQLNEIGRARERIVLRRNAAEENNWIFLNWERLQRAGDRRRAFCCWCLGNGRKETCWP